MDSTAMVHKPHAVCIPFPAQGHINPMLILAKLLYIRGFHITFVNLEYNHKLILKSRGFNSFPSLPSFRFVTIPDGLPEFNADLTQIKHSVLESIRSKQYIAPFRDLLSKLNDTASSRVPPVTCIVSDSLMTFTCAAADEFVIPQVFLWTASVCGFMSCPQFCNLIKKSYIALKGLSYIMNKYLDRVINWIPGMKGIRLKDLSSSVRTTDLNDFIINFVLSEIDNTHRASAIIFNTFEKLDHDILKALSSRLPPIYPIGPLHLLLNQIDDDSLKLMGLNMLNEEIECLEWLNSKEPGSVVYVNFGSTTVMTPNQLVEFAWGIANSYQTFLWIIRPDIVAGDSVVLPPEFVEATKERSLIAGWCPQEQVIAHSSVGGFLTHCGWNSILESISSGVPIVCWPYFMDQPTNCWRCCGEWGIGMKIGNDVRRYEVESLVRELMVGEKGKKMKKRAMGWKKLAEEAIESSCGSSFMNLDKMVNQVLLSPKH